MARGWESKSVEAQQDAAGQSQPAKPPVSAEQAQWESAHATLTLARTRATADLTSASAPMHRAMLERAIADLEARLTALGDKPR